MWLCVISLLHVITGISSTTIHHCYYGHTTDQAEWLRRNTLQLACPSPDAPRLHVMSAALGYTAPLLVVGSGAVEQACPSLSFPGCEIPLHTVWMTCEGKSQCQLFHQPLPLLPSCRDTILSSNSRPVSFLHVEYECKAFQSPPLSFHRCLESDGTPTSITCPDGEQPSIESLYVGYSPRTSNNCPPTVYQCTIFLENVNVTCDAETRTCEIPQRLTRLQHPGFDPRWPMCTDNYETNYVHVQYFCKEEAMETTSSTTTMPVSSSKSSRISAKPTSHSTTTTTTATTTTTTTTTTTQPTTTTTTTATTTSATAPVITPMSSPYITTEEDSLSENVTLAQNETETTTVMSLDLVILANITEIFNDSTEALMMGPGIKLQPGAIAGIVVAGLVLLLLLIALLICILYRKGKLRSSKTSTTMLNGTSNPHNNNGIDNISASPHIYDTVADHTSNNNILKSQPSQLSISSAEDQPGSSENGIPNYTKPPIPNKPIFLTKDSYKPVAQVGVVQPNCHLNAMSDSEEALSTLYEDIEKFCRGSTEEINDHEYDDVMNISTAPQSRVSYISIQPDSEPEVAPPLEENSTGLGKYSVENSVHDGSLLEWAEAIYDTIPCDAVGLQLDSISDEVPQQDSSADDIEENIVLTEDDLCTITGNESYEQTGNESFEQTGNESYEQTDNESYEQTGNESYEQTGNESYKQTGNESYEQNELQLEGQGANELKAETESTDQMPTDEDRNTYPSLSYVYSNDNDSFYDEVSV